jgi:hypothetical protein
MAIRQTVASVERMLFTGRLRRGAWPLNRGRILNI